MNVKSSVNAYSKKQLQYRFVNLQENLDRLGFQWNCKRGNLIIIMAAMHACPISHAEGITKGMTDIEIAKEINKRLDFDAIDITQVDAYDYMQLEKGFADRINEPCLW